MSIASQQISCLQAMGIDVYRPYKKDSEKAAVLKKSWFPSLLNLLKLSEDNCQFSDSAPISYDPISKQLILPFTLDIDDAVLKREIWQHIKANVEL